LLTQRTHFVKRHIIAVVRPPAGRHACGKGRYVELHPTIPLSFGAGIDGGTRGIVQSVGITRPDDAVYLVGCLSNEKLTGECAWLR
jgi:hypothetical protein